MSRKLASRSATTFVVHHRVTVVRLDRSLHEPVVADTHLDLRLTADCAVFGHTQTVAARETGCVSLATALCPPGRID